MLIIRIVLRIGSVIGKMALSVRDCESQAYSGSTSSPQLSSVMAFVGCPGLFPSVVSTCKYSQTASRKRVETDRHYIA